VDFTGQRVGVIGTGSSGIQAIPRIAEQAARLTVFQRTPNFSIPARRTTLEPGELARFKADYPAYRQRARESHAGVPVDPVEKGALEVDAAERRRTYETVWEAGGVRFMRAFNDLAVNRAANDTAAEFVREKIRQTVRDSVVAEALAPKDHPIGTKRICVDVGYFETYNRDNVALVDLRRDPILEITPEGVRTRSGLHRLDSLVFATGFDAMTGALLAIDIRGRGGRRLADDWAAGPRTYLGLMTAGYPNLFIVTGPGSPSVLANMIVAIEQNVDWIADCLVHLRRHGIERIEADAEAQDAWVGHVNEVASHTLFPSAASWYMGANVPGKPRVFMPYIGGLDVYDRKCREVARNGYDGFVLG
jgi:cyclohexanone monooxygenase